MNESNHAPAVRRKSASRRRAANRAERGAQLIELAIVVPVMFLLLAATVEFGLYYNTYITLAKATRVGARYLASKEFELYKLEAKQMVVCGVPRETACDPGTEVVKGLTADNVEINYTPFDPDTALPSRVEIKIVNYQYQPFFDLGLLTGGASWASVDVNPSTTMAFMVEN